MNNDYNRIVLSPKNAGAGNFDKNFLRSSINTSYNNNNNIAPNQMNSIKNINITSINKVSDAPSTKRNLEYDHQQHSNERNFKLQNQLINSTNVHSLLNSNSKDMILNNTNSNINSNNTSNSNFFNMKSPKNKIINNPDPNPNIAFVNIKAINHPDASVKKNVNSNLNNKVNKNANMKEPLQEVIFGVKNSLLVSLSGFPVNKIDAKETNKKSQSPLRKEYLKSTSKNVGSFYINE